MDLSFLIPSKVRRAVLDFFVKNPDAQVGVRELARRLNLSPQVTHRELVNLEGWGFLFSSNQEARRSFRMNKKFILAPPICDLFRVYEEARKGTYEIVDVLDWKKMESRYKKIKVPLQLIPGLTAERKRPRAWEEEKAMKRKGLL